MWVMHRQRPAAGQSRLAGLRLFWGSGAYVRSAIISILGLLKRLVLWPMPLTWRRRVEASLWGAVDLESARRISWDSIECLGRMAVQAMTGGQLEELMDVIVSTITPPDPRRLRGLTLGCGDMVGERWFFTHPKLPFELVDAYDISAEAISQAQQLTDALGLKVRYHLEDVNGIRLPVDTYDLAVVAHSMHHFRRIDHIVGQINRSLKPGGLLVVWEYVGPRRQRFHPRQRAYANMVFQALPSKYRRQPDGRVTNRVRSQPLLFISPDEAVRSERILPALKRMRILYQYNWAGLLFPLLRGGIAANFDEHDAEDRRIINCLFELDRLLCQSGRIAPNFTITIAAKDNCSRVGELAAARTNEVEVGTKLSQGKGESV